jgi:NTE family protein
MDDKSILVLSGGSLKGIAHIGVLKALKEKNILKNINTIAGTSIGGIIGCLHIIGYSPEELEEFVNEFDFLLVRDIKIDKLLTTFGIDDGKKLEYVFSSLFKMKEFSDDITLNELYDKTKIELIMPTICLNEKKLCYLSYKNYPNLRVITALRMTSSIPFWFVPVIYENKSYIDGGLMNNYPISIFDKDKKKVIGVFLNEERHTNENINNIETFLFDTLECIFEGVSRSLIGRYVKQTIELKLLKISFLNLNTDIKMKKDLFLFGYNEAIKFLENIESEKKSDNKNNDEKK